MVVKWSKHDQLPRETICMHLFESIYLTLNFCIIANKLWYPLFKRLRDESHVEKDIPHSFIARFAQRLFLEYPHKGFKLLAKIKRVIHKVNKNSKPHRICFTYNMKKTTNSDSRH